MSTAALRVNGIKFGTSDSSVHVSEFGAACDGTTDDSTALQNAINAVNAAGGGTVTIPANSKCRIASAIEVKANVTLQGTNSNGYNYTDQSGSYPVGKAGSWIYVDVGAGSTSSATPALKLDDNVTIRDLNFYYPNQLDGGAVVGSVVLYPPTIGLATTVRVSPRIIDVNFNNAYIALDLNGAQKPLVQNVGIGAVYRGIMLDNCQDIARFENIHVWPFFQPNGSSNVLKTYAQNNLIAFYLGRIDGLQADKIFALGGYQGVYCYSGTGGSMWGRIQNFELDSFQLPIDIEAGNTFQQQFLNGVIIVGNASGPTYNAYGVRYNGGTDAHVLFDGIRMVDQSGTHVRDAFQLASGWNVLISNSYLWCGGTDDSVGNPASHIHVTGAVTGIQICNVVTRDTGTGSKIISVWAAAATTMTISNWASWAMNTDFQQDNAGANVMITGSRLQSGTTSVNQTAGSLFLTPGNQIVGAITTTSAPQTWDSRDGTVKAATLDRTTAGTLAIASGVATQVNIGPSAGGVTTHTFGNITAEAQTSTSGSQLKNSPGVILPVHYWNGSADTFLNVAFQAIVDSTTPTAHLEAQFGGAAKLKITSDGRLAQLVGTAIASATTIAPTSPVHHITGTTTIQTITAPSTFNTSGFGGRITLIFDGVAPWNAAGNIFVAGTPTTAGTTVDFTYDNATSKWYPSRTL